MRKILALSLAFASQTLTAEDSCEPQPPATCYPDACEPCYCSGPAEIISNAPVNPLTCDGDFIVGVSALYWKANQDGLEYGLSVHLDPFVQFYSNFTEGEYLTPKFDYHFGLKVDVGYVSPCDGWDIHLQWTNYHGSGSSDDNVTPFFISGSRSGENRILLPIWTAYAGKAEDTNFGISAASRIQTKWNLTLNMIDLKMGRNHWVSRRLAMEPFISIRYAQCNQSFDLLQQGGSWQNIGSQFGFNDDVDLRNDFCGVGPSSGFELNWNIGCGWSLLSEIAASILYGRFFIKHDEHVRRDESPFEKIKILETKNNFRASRGVLDLALGVQYSTLLCDCKYGFTANLLWEQHLFFNQNQLWRVERALVNQNVNPINSSGMNDHNQKKGTLATDGLTLNLEFAF